MGKTIKREVIAYKGMDFNMTCKGFQYEVGKTYKTDKAELCKWGFHACLNPLDVLGYYSQDEGSRYFKVKLSGKITKCTSYDTKVAATKITILEEISIKELRNITEWRKNKNVLDLLYYPDGFARIRNCDKKYNFIDKQGKLLSEQWFEWVDNFKDGLAVVKNEDYVYNFIDKNGKILSDKWFNVAYSFKDGFAEVQRTNGLRNFINKDGKILSDEWFNDVTTFYDGLAKVERTNGELCKIDKSGKLYKD